MIVIDASVGFKWLFKKNELHLTKANELLIKHLSQENEITVPDLFFYEISNTLVTKSSIPSRLAIELVNNLFSFNLISVKPNQQDIVKSIQLSKKHSTTVYDMLYAVVAKENKATLITADENFIRKTGFKFVKHIRDL